MKRSLALFLPSLVATASLSLCVAACARDVGGDSSESVGTTRAPLVGSPFPVGDAVAGPPRLARQILDVTYGAGEYFVTSLRSDTMGGTTSFPTEHARIAPDTTAIDPVGVDLGAGGWASTAFDGTNFRVASYRYGITNSVDTLVVAPSGEPIGSWQPVAGTLTAGQDIECASDGTCLVIWANGNQVLGERLDAQGAKRDAAPLVLGTLGSSSGGFPWLSVERVGAGYVAFWDGVWAAPIADDGTVGPAVHVYNGGAGSNSTTANGTFALLAVSAWDNSQAVTYVVRVGPDGKPLDPAPVEVTIGNPFRAEVVATGDSFALVWPMSSYANELRLDANGEPKDTAPIMLPTPAANGAWSGGAPRAATAGATALMVQPYSDGVNVNQSRVYATALDATGTVTAGPTLVSGEQLPQYTPNVVWDGQTYVAAWIDPRSGGQNGLYAARVGADGSVLDAAAFPLAANLAGTPARPHMASNGDGALAVWKQATSGNQGTVQAAVVRGGAVFKALTVTSPPFLFDDPAVASDGSQYLVAWTDTRSGTSDLYVARVDGSGTLIDAGGNKVLTAQTIANGTLLPEMAWTGSSYVIAYLDPVGGDLFKHDVKAVWVAPDGTLLHGPSSLSNATEQAANGIALACAPELGVCLSAWDTAVTTGNTTVENGLVYRRLDATGLLDGPTPMPGSAGPRPLHDPTLGWDGEGFVLGAAQTTTAPYGVAARWIAPDGRLVGASFADVADHVLDPGAAPRVAAAAPNFKALLVWPQTQSRIEGSLLGDDGIPDAGPDTGVDASSSDAGADTGVSSTGSDAGADTGVDAGLDTGVDAGPLLDGGDAAESDAASDGGAHSDAGDDSGPVALDAGNDAPQGPVDAGANDAGSPSGVADGSPDAGGSNASDSGGGCGCTTAGNSGGASPFALLGAAVVFVVVRTRRRRRGAHLSPFAIAFE